jgi:hypothetical protein
MRWRRCGASHERSRRDAALLLPVGLPTRLDLRVKCWLVCALLAGVSSMEKPTFLDLFSPRDILAIIVTRSHRAWASEVTPIVEMAESIPRALQNVLHDELAPGERVVWYGQPSWAWWVARRTLYAVTDRRALVIERPLGRSTVQGFSGDRLTDAIRREDILGRGELIFERVVSKRAKGRAAYRDVGFFGLADARGVASVLPVPAPAPVARASATRAV